MRPRLSDIQNGCCEIVLCRLNQFQHTSLAVPVFPLPIWKGAKAEHRMRPVRP